MPAYSRSSSTRSTTGTSTTRRYWRRTEKPSAWWPWGVLPVAGLVALFLFGAAFTAPEIQAQVRQNVGDRLGQAGVSVGSIAADGQRITARIPADERPDGLVAAVAESTTCDTWAGKLRCPSLVKIEREATKAAPPVIEQRPHQFEIRREADSIVLRGEVPSAEEHQRIVDLAGSYFGQFEDQLTISNERAGDLYGPAADRALAVVNHLDNGTASWSGQQLSISGVASADNAAAARAEFGASGAQGMLGRFDVQSPASAATTTASCNDAFNAALTGATIRFRTSSADIDAGNDELLARLAEIASNCPGSLKIEGHTDSRGDAEMNQALSQARANSVRAALAARGVDSGRIAAVGYGETQPVASNDTPEGRAQNRRIAISVDATN